MRSKKTQKTILRHRMTRREALQAMGLGTAGLLAGCQTVGRKALGGKWYRGNLHMHTYWSDGRVFPEQAIDIYKKMGYDFIGLSDHNVFADDREMWRTVEAASKGWPPAVTQSIFDEYVRGYGDEVDTRQKDGKTQVRLKTYEEMRERFEEPGSFLLMPAVEITQVINDINVHLNYLNLPDVIPFVKGGSYVKKLDNADMAVSDLIGQNAKEVAHMAKQMGRPSLLMLNHPQWRYWDIQPQDLIDSPEVRFFEVCNGGSSFAPHPDALSVTNDKFWDAINAFRTLKGAPLIYGLGTDDTHSYINRTNGQRLANAWVMVRSRALTAEALLSAMDAGDYYATTGVLLDDVAFNASRRKLSVKVQAAPGVSCRIRFITTKRGFDQTVRTVECPAVKGHGKRTLSVYSEDVGKTAKIVDGAEASYQMAADDLYVRAKIESNVLCGFTKYFHPDTEVAWTQPYA